MEKYFINNVPFEDYFKSSSKLYGFGNKSLIIANKIKRQQNCSSIAEFVNEFNKFPNIRKSKNKNDYLFLRLLNDYDKYKQMSDRISSIQLKNLYN